MQVLQLLISGVAQGCIYGLIALGFVLIYKATETVSFAQGDLMMVGAFAGLAAMTWLGFPFWVSVPAAIVAMGVFGVLLERLVIRPILGQPAFSIVMLTIGVGYVLRGLITMIPDVGTDTHTMPVPYAGQVLQMGGLVVAAEQLVVIAFTTVLCLGLFAMFKYSKLGIAMQAASQNQLAAYYMGIPVKRLNGLVWGLAAAVAAIAGLLLVLAVGTDAGTSHAWWTFFMRWLHVLCGVMWIGLLWYFNFVQIPTMPAVPAELKPAEISGGMARRVALARWRVRRWFKGPPGH